MTEQSGLPQTTERTMTGVRVGLIGAGKMAQHHARAIRRIPQATLVGVVDQDPRALEAMSAVAPGVATYRDLKAMLAAGPLDVVHIVTPPQTHVPLAHEALEHGCHIYLEKPFAPTLAETRELLSLAEARGLKVCAGHQLLFEQPARIALALLPSLGRLIHVESYFSFRTVRRAPGGRAPLSSDLQLLDILPHPVYVLLHCLETQPGRTEVESLKVGHRGTVHGLVSHGDVTGSLVVTLEGRPIESYLRLVGTNGSIYADFVRGTVQRHIGPGTSGIDKLLAPYRQSWQTFWGTTGAMARRFLKKQRSYPGLQEIFTAFYTAVREGGPEPVSAANIRETVALCERVAEALKQHARQAPAEPHPDLNQRLVVLTGGTGFLGRTVAESLVQAGWRVRALARRVPAAWEMLAGVEYRAADLGGELDPALFADAELVIHAAAETAGGWEDHQRNSIAATESVFRRAAEAGVRRIIHVSSLAVLDNASVIRDDTPLLPDSRKQGPYVWGKLESERLAGKLADELGIELRVVRPGAIVDYRDFDPPGRLGKRLGNWFVAVGSPRHRLGVVDLTLAGKVIVSIAEHFATAPAQLNLLDPVLPTKRELLNRLKRSNPDLSVIWLPTVVLVPLSWAAILAQKVLRPGKPAINVARVFSVQRYDTSRMAQFLEQGAGLHPQARSGPAAAMAHG